ncbi:hypothetical protein QJS66_02460 [Kocuria rhizophila]|nr:hypothetical protein QJS66_02460 [Kocuria rhizophila]
MTYGTRNWPPRSRRSSRVSATDARRGPRRDAREHSPRWTGPRPRT